MRRSSTALNWRIDSWLVLAIAALIAVLFYLMVSALIFRIGFPLDDSWIHLTYARNFAEHGEWAFRLGERSAGSTSPLWTVLLSIGFLLGSRPIYGLISWLGCINFLGSLCRKYRAKACIILYSRAFPGPDYSSFLHGI